MPDLPAEITIPPVTGPLRARVRPPGSKSITNRALVCAALARGTSTLRGALDSEDTRVMIDCLRALGIPVKVRDGGATLQVNGCSGVPPADEAELFVGNSGTTIRFLTALATLGAGEFRLDGVARMHERPIGDLVDALRQLGADIDCEGPNGCPPVVVHALCLGGGEVNIRGDISSQFLSGLLMAAPCAGDITVHVKGPLVSKPYVAMTLKLMRAFGVETTANEDFSEIQVPANGCYRAREFSIEPDASGASYFWAAAAVTGGEVVVEGLARDSLQGDVGFVACLEQMGCQVRYEENCTAVVGGPLHAIDVDMNGISDTVQTLAVVALFAKGTTHIRNVAHIRHKETDRIVALANELRKLGADVIEHDDGLEITPGPPAPAAIDTYDDHRMAMSFAVAGLKLPGVVIRNPGCVEKTYPQFFEDLDRARRSQSSSG